MGSAVLGGDVGETIPLEPRKVDEETRLERAVRGALGMTAQSKMIAMGNEGGQDEVRVEVGARPVLHSVRLGVDSTSRCSRRYVGDA